MILFNCDGEDYPRGQVTAKARGKYVVQFWGNSQADVHAAIQPCWVHFNKPTPDSLGFYYEDTKLAVDDSPYCVSVNRADVLCHFVMVDQRVPEALLNEYFVL